MESNENQNHANKIINPGFDYDDEEENEFNWMSKNEKIEKKDNLKDNFNPISLLQSNQNKNNLNEENNLIEEMQKLNLGINKQKSNISKDLVFNYYFGAGNNNNENKHNLNILKKNNNEKNILMNNQMLQGSRFIGMNSVNNTNLNNEDFLKNKNELNLNNFNNEKISSFNNNKNLILTQPYIPKKNRIEENSNNPNFQNKNLLNQNIQNLNINIQNYNITNQNEIQGKFFVIKSIDEANIIRSINFKIWCSTIKGNQKLQKAFKEADKKYPIYLFFSVNGSGKFMGVAQMASDVEYRVNFNYWSQNDKWKGFFFVNWIFIKDIPNRIFRQIINEYNDNKPVTSSRDTQEIFPSAGMRMLKIFKEYPQESSIFDSMNMEEKMMIYQQQQQNKNNNQRQQINFGMGINNMNNLNMNNMNFNNMNLNMNNLNNMNNLSNMNNMNLNNMNLNNMNLNNMNNMMNYNKMNLSQQQMMMMMQQRKQQMMNMNNQENNF